MVVVAFLSGHTLLANKIFPLAQDRHVNLPLSIAMASNPRTNPLHDGIIKADGIDLMCSAIFPSEIFWRQLKFADFDVSEMSLSSFLMAKDRGDTQWVGLPVFTTRHFFQNWALKRTDRGINSPADLKGKKIGVPDYQQTAALWTRGILKDEFGVEASDMEYWMERSPERSHAGAVGFEPPAGIVINQIPPEKNIGSMMASGELDATLLYIRETNLVDRSTIDLEADPHVSPLFDRAAEGARYLRKTGVYPINHAMVVRREIAERHPWVILNLYKAFAAANAYADKIRMEQMEYYFDAGFVPPEAKAVVGQSLTPHGIKANRHILEAVTRYSFDQGLTSRKLSVDELFAKSTLDT